MPRRRLRNHRRMNHPRDHDNDPEKTIIDEIAGEAIERDLRGKAPDPADDNDLEHVPDTTSTDISESGSCMEVHGDEEWVRDYEEMSENNTWPRDTADRGDE